VRVFWTVHGEATEKTELQCIPPDGCMELILQLGAPVEALRDGRVQRQPLAVLIGENRRPSFVRPLGAIDALAARITPAGVRAFFDEPASSLVDATFVLDELADAQLRESLDGVRCAEPHDRLRLFEAALIAKVRRNRRYDALIGRLALRMEREDVPVETLANDVGFTRRQLERRFADAVGMAPKALAQVLRFQRVLGAIVEEAPRWVDIAAECGYCDQSHLIRDFKRFTGTSPRGFLGLDHPFASLFRPSNDDVAFVQSRSALAS
jgi:AraC-like DNA-binding protein